MGRLLAPVQSFKINRKGNVNIPTLISSAGNSQNYVFSPTDDIYFEAEIYLNSYDIVNTILGSSSSTYNVINEYEFAISDVTEVGDRGIPQGAVVVYNGERGSSLSCYYTDGATVDLNAWTKIVAKRINGNWSIFINNIECAVSRVTDAGVPNDQFGNLDLPVYIGRSEAGGLNFDGQIRNVILSNKIKNNKILIKKQNLGGGKMSLFFDTLPLNTQSIKLNLDYVIGGCGNDFFLNGNYWTQNGCDFYVSWDNKNGTLPYKWRFYYNSDGRTDYAFHPTAGPDALPKKGWSNDMTISENQLITFGQSLVLNNLPFDANSSCNFSIFNRTWIYLGAPSFRYRPIDNLFYYINTPLTSDGYGGNGSYQIRSSDDVYFTNNYNNSDKFPSDNWQLASYIIDTCPQITTTPIFSLL